MKWGEKEVNYLKNFYNKKSIEELSLNLKTTKRGVQVKMQRLGLSLNDYKWEFITCKHCKKSIKVLKCEKRIYCSKSCSASDTNKSKIKSINKINNKKKKTKKKPTYLKTNISFCKNCNKVILSKRKICDDCNINYYKYYRPNSRFKFSIKEFSYLFSKQELELLKKYKMYSASNRGNNLQGVSRDHRLSVKEGFKNKIHPLILAHPANCKLMLHSKNNAKHDNSSISYQDLKSQILISELIQPYLNKEILEKL